MKIITDTAVEKCRTNNRVISRLVLVFDKHHVTIERWFDSKDIRLTTPEALQIIREETELDDTQILEEEKKASA